MRCSSDMKASLSEYMKELSGNELSILEEVISKKYRKFINFFNLVSEYSEDIVSLKYNFTTESILDVELMMQNMTKREIKRELIDDLEILGYQVESKGSGKKMNLIIEYDESQMY